MSKITKAWFPGVILDLQSYAHKNQMMETEKLLRTVYVVSQHEFFDMEERKKISASTTSGHHCPPRISGGCGSYGPRGAGAKRKQSGICTVVPAAWLDANS